MKFAGNTIVRGLLQRLDLIEKGDGDKDYEKKKILQSLLAQAVQYSSDIHICISVHIIT